MTHAKKQLKIWGVILVFLFISAYVFVSAANFFRERESVDIDLSKYKNIVYIEKNENMENPFDLNVSLHCIRTITPQKESTTKLIFGKVARLIFHADYSVFVKDQKEFICPKIQFKRRKIK